jgi:hypothetical protein
MRPQIAENLSENVCNTPHTRTSKKSLRARLELGPNDKDGETYALITQEIRPFPTVMQKSRPKAPFFVG